MVDTAFHYLGKEACAKLRIHAVLQKFTKLIGEDCINFERTDAGITQVRS